MYVYKYRLVKNPNFIHFLGNKLSKGFIIIQKEAPFLLMVVTTSRVYTIPKSGIYFAKKNARSRTFYVNKFYISRQTYPVPSRD